MKLIRKASILFLLLFLFLPVAVGAQDSILPDGDNPSHWSWDQLIETIENIAEILLSLVAAIAIIFIIIGGYRYIFAFGDPETAQQAKNTITWAILGLILALMAVMIIKYIEGKIEPHAPSLDFPGEASTEDTPEEPNSSEGEGDTENTENGGDGESNGAPDGDDGSSTI
jgi:type IV secretory pathway VirB2 component (pilin)